MDLGLPPVETVVSAGVPIAVRDHGRHPFLAERGWAGDVLLLPAARGSAADWDAAAGLLRGLGYRPVAVDPRGHGGSGAGDWTWPAVLADLAAVVESLGLDRPAVVGHGLGGAVAALWAGQHPECPLAVSIDGYGNPTRAEQLSGVDGDPAALVEAFSGFLAAAITGLPEPLTQALRAVERLDVPAVYRAVRCPTVALISEESDLAEVLPTELGLAWLAYLDWIRRELARLEGQAPLFSVATTTGSNDAYLTRPEHLAGLLAGLLDEQTAPRVTAADSWPVRSDFRPDHAGSS